MSAISGPDGGIGYMRRTENGGESRDDTFVNVLPGSVMRMCEMARDSSATGERGAAMSWCIRSRLQGHVSPLAPYVNLFNKQLTCLLRQES